MAKAVIRYKIMKLRNETQAIKERTANYMRFIRNPITLIQNNKKEYLMKNFEILDDILNNNKNFNRAIENKQVDQLVEHSDSQTEKENHIEAKVPSNFEELMEYIVHEPETSTDHREWPQVVRRKYLWYKSQMLR